VLPTESSCVGRSGGGSPYREAGRDELGRAEKGVPLLHQHTSSTSNLQRTSGAGSCRFSYRHCVQMPLLSFLLYKRLSETKDKRHMPVRALNLRYYYSNAL